MVVTFGLGQDVFKQPSPESTGAGVAAGMVTVDGYVAKGVMVGVSVYVITRLLDRILFGSGR